MVCGGIYERAHPTISQLLMKIIHPDSKVQIITGGPVRISQILCQFYINPSEVIVSRNGKLVPEDTLIGDDDEIRIIRIAHGG